MEHNQNDKNKAQDNAGNPASGSEEKPGLLRHEHISAQDSVAAKSLESIDEYHPDTHHADQSPTQELIEEAAHKSHHGLIREAETRVKISREEEAKLALEHTSITRPMCWTMTLLFLCTIFSVPILQSTVEMRRNIAERQVQIANGEQPEKKSVPTILEAWQELPSQEQIRSVSSPQEAWNLIPAASRFQEHENRLQDDSILIQWTLPRIQNLLLQVGVGNEQAYIGRDGWLMYRPDVDYATSRGFLDAGLQQVRKRSGCAEREAVQPDPIRAVVQFKQQLAIRGIELVVVPVPVKAIIHAEKMSSRYAFSHPLLQNSSYDEFRQKLKKEGVLLFDVAPILLQEKQRTGKAQYLDTDTHWTPQAMELTARELAKFIQSNVQLPPVENAGLIRKEQAVSNMGDIAEMLKLPANQTFYKKQEVQIQQVQTPDGEPLYPTHDADLLLLGDSFSNIYSFREMNWGEAAGFGEQLSFHLQRPFDAIINNAGGSYVTRQQLVRDLARGKDRLHGKRLVIWEFAMRDLLNGDWKLLDLPKARRKH
ncbi:MAG TPA: hypothetical protein VGB77_03960 [Abditibacteriaceae bacterium]|jgi:alginate O-acetyltransferase complex protein AlgJ